MRDLGIAQHMLGLGLGALAHANWHANYHSFENAYWSELSVLQAAHAAEILIKARIAVEHPLLIFEQVPKMQSGSQLELQHLMAAGRTYQYSDLPNRLWAATGIELPALETYRKFGQLRNTIQHFAPPSDIDASREAINFIYEVIDPLINRCWGYYAVDYNEDTEPYVYLIAGLVRRGVRFLVSPQMIKHLEYIDLEWPRDTNYRSDMEARIAEAREKH